MSVSYLCDMVGHIPQMPQIVKGFGYEYYCGWRGVIDGKERNESEFIWEAPDGSQVLFKVMPYSYHTQFPNDLDTNIFLLERFMLWEVGWLYMKYSKILI